MSFLNRYNNSELQIESAKEFLESNQLFNYSVGNSTNYPTILKSRTDGSVIWKKEYFQSEWNNIVFKEIIQSINSSQQIEYIIYGKYSSNHYLIKINSNGELLSINKINLIGASRAFLVESKINNSFYLVFSGLYDGPEPTYGGMGLKQLMVLEFDNEINVVNQNYYYSGSAFEMILNSVKSYEEGLLIVFDHKGGNTHLLDLNYNLTVKINKEIHIGNNANSDFYSHDVVIVSNDLLDYTRNRYFISGSKGSGEILLLGLDGANQNYITEIPNTRISGSSNMIIVDNELYLNVFRGTHEEQGSVIHKININDFSRLQIIWSKTFKIDKDYYGVKRLIKSEINPIFIYPSSDGVLLFDSNLELSTCITVLLNYTLNRSNTFNVVNRLLDTNLISYRTDVIENFQVFDNSIEPEKICSSNLDPDLETCIKDDAICAEHNKLQGSFNQCVDKVKNSNPNYIEKLSLFQNCFRQFIETLLQINSNFPQYSLEEQLRFQIKAITIYNNYIGDNGIEGYYYDALSSVEFIFEYLSQLGNCNCENVLELSDYSSIQSGNLYLQSAGSKGQDSTKGIHLRWAFKDALSNHLPKANYATTTHNFNKNDDYVKIYRAKYVPYITKLDFRNAPLQVNEFVNRKNWIYKINGKVFHVHFRDINKYNLVRASLNPISNTLQFIKNYGDSVLEIETKRELSFKIAPVFQILDSNNFVKTEILSVSENTISSPKVASLRKKYTVGELNDNPLLSENIRSIRFSSSGAHIAVLQFEFYADFITNTKKLKKWSFLGKYALTKETNVAYQRLEPKAECLKEWLRYNDQAFVNIGNYHTKWNSESIPELERIHFSVEKYIELSDSFSNPTAEEIFPFVDSNDVDACNLTYPDNDPNNPEYDPYIPDTPTEDTGIVIPFLEVLKLGSLDYHVARMLGLGTLDLNPLVFDGQYMYLSEYVTFGDLHDGLGAREVQHLYCSLPTSLEDQRLPLPVDLKEPVPGIFFPNSYDNSDVDENEEEFNEIEQINLVTDDGYSQDGKTKYYTLFPEYEIDELADAPFYYISNEFIASEYTEAVFAGLEYRKAGDINWIKPELSHHPNYFNIDTSGVAPELKNETVELVIPEEGKPLFTHAVKENGKLNYSSYGINWFSRSVLSSVVHLVETVLPTINELLPPTNITATLIQKEIPLFLTSSEEQGLFTQNLNSDKTLVRLTFDYNYAQELIDYHQKIDGEIIPTYFETENSKELFAEKIQIFFKDQAPNSVSGKIKFLSNNSNPLLIEVDTEPFSIYSSGVNNSITPQTIPPTYNENLIPIIQNGTESNYIGSIMLVDNIEYVIHEIDNSGLYPKFTVFKADASGAILNIGSFSNPETEILVPEIGSMFVIVENMQNQSNWGIPTNSGFSVNIDQTIIHREDDIIIKNIDCSTETHIQKFRGIYQNAIIEKIMEKIDEDGDGQYDTDVNGNFILKHLGLYKITFPGFKLQQHSQYYLESNPGSNSVQWYNGMVRLHTLFDNNGPRKEFKVIKTEHIDSTTDDLVLYIDDLSFPNNLSDLGTYKGKLMADEVSSINQMTNYYPGYKVYLYKDDNLGLNKDSVMPQGDDEVRYTVFGLRSWDFPNEFSYDNTEDFFSKMSVPALMFANAVIEPVQPQKPTGGRYATRPDYFGKSSFTFTTKYGTAEQIHKPYSVQFNRASDIQFLSAIYNKDVLGYNVETGLPVLNTVQEVMQNIFLNGEEDFYVNRWNDLLSFNYPTGNFATFDERTLPLPDSPSFINSINAFIDAHNVYYNNLPIPIEHISVPIINLNETVIPEVLMPNGEIRNTELKIKDFLKDVLMNCFVPLTEIPVLYNYVKPYPYKPIPKKQVVRDRNGNLLQPTLDPESDFDMAPMMCRIDSQGGQYESQFTDFGLDGASNAKYFYAVREINNQMKTSDYSEILGPISLVNTAPPVAPEIIKVIPVLENRILGVTPSIQLQINAYPKAQNIAKVSIYRADNPSDALSIRTMKLVKFFDLEVENLLEESKWIFEDDFSDLPETPFGDPLFYKLTVSRRIRYNDKELINVIDYTPSEASKLIITNLVENYTPNSPILDYYSEPLNSNNDLTRIVLHWEKTCYKGKYHLYKMNSQGNWVKIYELETNDQDTYLPLEFTDLNSSTLSILDSENNSIYHHFKIIAENTAGMMSSEENILTVYNEENWKDIGGIGDMIVGGTFYIR